MSERERVLAEINEITSDVHAFMCNQDYSIDEILTFALERIEDFTFDEETQKTLEDLLWDTSLEEKTKQLIQLILTSYIANQEENLKKGRGWA